MRPKPSSPSAARWAAGRMSTTSAPSAWSLSSSSGSTRRICDRGRSQEIVGAARRQRAAAAFAPTVHLFHSVFELPAAVGGPRHVAHHELVPAQLVERHGGQRRAVDVQAERVLVRFVGHVVDVPGAEPERGSGLQFVADQRELSGVVPPRHRFHEDAADHAHRSGGSAVVVELDLPTLGPGDQPGVEVSRAGHQPPGAGLACPALPASARRGRGGSPPRWDRRGDADPRRWPRPGPPRGGRREAGGTISERLDVKPD